MPPGVSRRSTRRTRLSSQQRDHQSTSPVTEQQKIDQQQFDANPLAFYRKMLVQHFTYKEFDKEQEFNAIVLKKLPFTSTDVEAFFPNPIKIDRNKTAINEAAIELPELFLVFIPDLDRASIIPRDLKDQVSINLLETNDRKAFYLGQKVIEPGYIVRVSQVISAQEKKLPIRITEVLSKNKVFEYEEEATALDISKKCIESLKLKPPPTRPQATPTPINTTPPQDPQKSIYSSDKYPTESPKLFPILKKESTTPQKTEQQKKQEAINKTQNKLADVGKACADNKAETPTSKDETVDDKPVDRAFLKDGVRKKQTEIKGKYSFNYKKYVLEAVEDVNSGSPAILLPPEVREPRMIVIKEAPYMTMDEYYQAIKTNKSYAAHFCIDYKGEVYQLTDTCNIIKSYNPLIDEMSVQVALLNISFRNSPATKTLLQKFDNSKAQSVDLSGKFFFDRLKLEAFYKNKGIKKQEVKAPPVPKSFLKGKGAAGLFFKMFLYNKTLLPDYRLDFTEDQKKSLGKLLIAVHHAYNIPQKIPEGFALDNKGKNSQYLFQQLEPEVISGNFSGIVCPYHFLLSSTDGYLNLKELFNFML